jgi:hypothetical protein
MQFIKFTIFFHDKYVNPLWRMCQQTQLGHWPPENTKMVDIVHYPFAIVNSHDPSEGGVDTQIKWN